MAIRTAILTAYIILFGISGISAQKKAYMNVFELSQPITEHLLKAYPGGVVKAAWKVDTSNVIRYEIRLVKSNMEFALIYDKDGQFLRKEMVSAIVAEKKPLPRRKIPKQIFTPEQDTLIHADSLILHY